MAVEKTDVLTALARGEEPRGSSVARDRQAVRRHRDRRQGVLLDHGRCRVGAELGAGAQGRRGRGARRAGRHLRDGRAHRRTSCRSPVRRRAVRAARPSPAAPPGARPSRPPAGGTAAGGAGRRGHHRGRIGQGRGRQIHHRRQSRARTARSRPQGRRARCRHLRTVGAQAARPFAASRRPSAARAHARWMVTASR